MGEQIARFGDDGRVAIEGGESFASRLDSGVVLRRDVGDREPLCFGVDLKKRLISGIRQIQEMIGAFLNGRSGERDRREQAKKEWRKNSANHIGSLIEPGQV